MKTLLILSGSAEAVDVVSRAKALGLTVVACDRDPAAPAFAVADSCLVAEPFSASEAAAAAERYSRKIRKIDAVLCIALNATLAAATIAERLGLAGPSPATAETVSDRLLMLKRLSDCGMRVPGFKQIHTIQELQQLAVQNGTNMVIKPVDGRDGSGVQHVAHVRDLAKAFELARSCSPTQRVMVEQYVEGPKVTTESIVIDRVCRTVAIADCEREQVAAPYIIDAGGDLPSRLPVEMQDKIRHAIEQGAAALGIENGTVRGDIIVRDGEPYVIALAPYLSGGFFCTQAIPIHTGIDFVGCAIRLALGEKPLAEDVTPKFERPVVRRNLFPATGKAVAVTGVETAASIEGVAKVAIQPRDQGEWAAGEPINTPAATVIATGASPEAAIAAANDAVSCLKIQNG